MRRWATALGVLAAVGLVAMFVAGSATAARPKKVVEGTVYDTTCLGTTCGCPTPPCGGPVTQGRSDLICAEPQQQRRIVCPLAKGATVAPDFCIQGQPCGTVYPLYEGEGAVVKIRKRGSAKVIATVPVVEGHFKIALGFGEYMMRTFLGEPQCWQGTKQAVLVSKGLHGPAPASLYVDNACVAHPDALTKPPLLHHPTLIEGLVSEGLAGPIYTAEGTYVTVRRQHSPTVIDLVTAVGGRFEVELGRGRYVIAAHPPEGTCFFKGSARQTVGGRYPGPLEVTVELSGYGQPEGDGYCYAPVPPAGGS
jgi:hypothetical protein